MKVIQAEIVDSNVPLSAILLKVRLLSRDLKNPAFDKWLRNERDGYNGDEIPDYRIVGVQPIGDFISLTQQISNLPIPMHHMPKEFRDRMAKAYLAEGVKMLESSAGEDAIFTTWDSQLVAIWNQISQEENPYGARLMAVRVPVIGSVLQQILSTIRNRLQEFILELEDHEWILEHPKEHKNEVERLFQVNILSNNDTNMSTFNQQGQTVQNQLNAGRDAIASGTFNFGNMNSRSEFIQELQGFKKSLGQMEESEEIENADFELASALQEAKKPEPKKSVIEKHLASAKFAVQALATGAALADNLDKLMEAGSKLFGG